MTGTLTIDDKNSELHRFRRYAAELDLRADKADIMDGCVQHGNTSCLRHSVAVAYFSLLLADSLRLGCDRDSLVRGALLHDYFLYDWHEKSLSHRLHGFRHPRRALENAARDFDLNDVEKDIILRHMFPLVPVPPKSPEGALVCVVDKLCTIYEVFGRSCYGWVRYLRSV